jgi:hypothetical protein
MQAIVGTQYFKHSQVIAPGKVGSVGDTLASVRLRQSAPDMALRYDAVFSGSAEPYYGSNVQDGFSYSFTSGGGPARTLDSRLERKSFKTNHGWVYQDMRAPDKTLEPIMGSTGRYDWYNRVANTYHAKITGDAFLPLPGPYGPTSMTRGSQTPRIIATDRPTLPDLTDKPPEEIKGLRDKTVVGSICTDSQGRPYIRAVRVAPPGQSQTTATTSAPMAPPPPPASREPAPPAQQPTIPGSFPDIDLSGARLG